MQTSKSHCFPLSSSISLRPPCAVTPQHAIATSPTELRPARQLQNPLLGPRLTPCLVELAIASPAPLSLSTPRHHRSDLTVDTPFRKPKQPQRFKHRLLHHLAFLSPEPHCNPSTQASEFEDLIPARTNSASPSKPHQRSTIFKFLSPTAQPEHQEAN